MSKTDNFKSNAKWLMMQACSLMRKSYENLFREYLQGDRNQQQNITKLISGNLKIPMEEITKSQE